MDWENSDKQKDEVNVDDKTGKGKGHETGKEREPIKNVEPIVRRSALARTPPMGRTLSIPIQKCGSEGITQTERAEGVLTSVDDFGNKDEEKEVNPTVRRSALMRTPPTRQQKKRGEEKVGRSPKSHPETVVSDSEELRERAPPGRGRALSLPEIERVPLPWEMEVERPAKRKREVGQYRDTNRDTERADLDEERSRVEKLYKETRELVRKARSISEKLSELVIKNPNTKVEIKRGVEELDWVSQRLEDKGSRMKSPMDKVMRRVDRTDANVQTEGPSTGNSEGERDSEGPTREELMARLERALAQNRRLREENARLFNDLSRRQEQGVNALADKVEQEEEEASRIRELVCKGGGVKEFLTVAQDKWPQKCFVRTTIETKDVFELSREWDLATMVPENFDMEQGENKKLRDHFQGVEELKSQDVGVGGVAYLAEQVEIPGKDDEVRMIRRYVYYGVTTETGEDTCNVTEVLTCFMKIRERMERQGRKKLAILETNKMNRGYFRKIVEFTFANDDIEIILLRGGKSTLGSSQNKGKPTGGNIQNKGRERREESLIIKVTEDKPYARVLQEVRREIDIDRTGVTVTNIRKTRNGDVLMTVKAKEGKSQAELLEKEITRKLAGTETRVMKKRETVIYVTGMDAVTTEEELVEAMRGVIGNPTAEIKVSPFWPAFGGNQNTAVTVGREDAGALLARGSIRIGWVNCRLRERVQLTRCFRCWGFGHDATTCRGINRGDECMRCGEKGHIAKFCENEEMCWDCGQRGHRGGTTRCRKYRQMLAEAVRGKTGPQPQND